MTTLRRTFRVAASPEQVLQFAKLKFADADNRVARVRLQGTWGGFYLLRTAENHPELAEWVAAARVHLRGAGDGTIVTIEHAGTVKRRNGFLEKWEPLALLATVLVTATLELLGGLLRGQLESLIIGLVFLAAFVGLSRPYVTNHRRRDAHFAELSDALQEVLAPLSDPEIAPMALRIAAEFLK